MIDSILKEKFHRKKAPWGIHIFARNNPAHGRFMHLNILGHSAKHHGGQVINSMVQEIALTFHNRRCNLVNSTLTHLKTANQFFGGPHLLFNKFSGVPVFPMTIQRMINFPISGINPKTRQTLVIENDNLIIAIFHNFNIRLNIAGTLGVKMAARPRLQSDNLAHRQVLIR